MPQKQIVMEQLKQILQLKTDGVAIREIARRIGISRYSVRKYLALLDENSCGLPNIGLAEKAYNNDQLEHDTKRLQDLTLHFSSNSLNYP